MKNSRFNAFTLAEVLITLGIIGIVAALTIPAVIENHKRIEYSTRLKKFYSSMQQARIMYNAQNGTTDADWNFPKSNSREDMMNYWNEYFAPYFANVLRAEYETNHSKLGVHVSFTDGSEVLLAVSGAMDFDFDVNGKKGPNSRGKDIYNFLIERVDKKFTPYIWTYNIESENNANPNEPQLTDNMNDRDNVQKLCKRDGIYCSQLLYLDEWTYKKDYPHKL